MDDIDGLPIPQEERLQPDGGNVATTTTEDDENQSATTKVTTEIPTNDDDDGNFQVDSTVDDASMNEMDVDVIDDHIKQLPLPNALEKQVKIAKGCKPLGINIVSHLKIYPLF